MINESKKSRGDACQQASWSIQMFYDGKCPLCNREASMLRRMDTTGKIKFTDIAAEDFDASAYGMGLDALMAQIHARLPDGRWIRGVEVFRQLYSAVGYRKLVALSRLPGISRALDFGYGLFAKHRLRLTGRCDSSGTECRVNVGGGGSR